MDLLIAEGFDKVWAADWLDSFQLFTAGVCGLETFAELRGMIGQAGQARAERWARECVARCAPGELPSSSSPDPLRRKDGMKIIGLRRAKLR